MDKQEAKKKLFLDFQVSQQTFNFQKSFQNFDSYQESFTRFDFHILSSQILLIISMASISDREDTLLPKKILQIAFLAPS